MGYMYEDGRPDDFEGLLTTNRCMAVAFNHILKDKEGMVVELKYQEDYPEDRHGKFIVFKEDTKIKICTCENDKFESGQWLWMKEEEDGKENKNE